MSKAYDLHRLTVLVADDNQHMASLVMGILKMAGIKNVITANTGMKAWAEIRDRPVDIAVIDWMMPELTGFDLLKRLRTGDDSPAPLLPVIMMTGYTERWRVVAMRDVGATEVLAKPISAKALIDRVIHVVTKPRAFVETAVYFGPDRRRRFDLAPEGEERRSGADDGSMVDRAYQDGAMEDRLSQDEINALFG